MLTLFVPKTTTRIKSFAKVYNRLLLLLWFPVCVSGIMVHVHFPPLFYHTELPSLLVFLIGVIGGLFLHELSHAMAAYAYNVPVSEVGVLIRFLLPGAYVLMDEKRQRNRLKRAQIYAAGVEINLLQGGLFLGLSALVGSETMFNLGVLNLCLGFSNLLLVIGFDGAKLLELFYGKDLIVNAVCMVAFLDKSYWRDLFSNGLLRGLADLFVHLTLITVHILVIMIMIMEVLQWIL